MRAVTSHVGLSNETSAHRDEQIQDILNEIRAERAAGQVIRDEDIIARYPELSPELNDALALLGKIQISFRRIAASENSEKQIGSAYAQPSALESFPARVGGIAGYRLLRPIQRGGQGVVFLAIQESTQRQVAVKVLDGGAFVTPRKCDRFEREAKALAVLDHPGIVRIVDRGRTVDGSFFIAMDYVDGEDLDDYLEKQRKEGWNARQVVELFGKIAAAIGEAHRLGIIHRDIKPSNIRIDVRGEPRILDFGLARLTAAADDENPGIIVTQTGGVVGSLPWASPEQASGDSAKICPASDVYALGVVFFRALVGRSPYDLTGTLRQQIHNICEQVPVFPGKGDSTLPFGSVDSGLASVILKCLEKNPDRRYSDGIALAGELEDYLAGRLRKWPARGGRRRVILGVLMVVVILGSAAAWTMDSSLLRVQTATVPAVKLPMIKNSIGMEMLLIPAGTFMAGSPYTEEGHHLTEELHRVTLTHPYYIGRTEVTRAEYRRVMGLLPTEVAPMRGDDELPVDYVSRDQAEEFCRRLSAVEKQHYRLPTEAEWENACRAGTSTPFSGSGRINDIAWYAGDSNGQLHPVGAKQPNNWGLCDMEGNVSEWCADQFIDELGNGPVVNPVAFPRDKSVGVVRGGNYSELSPRCRSASRMQSNPKEHIAGFGFRTVMDLPVSMDGINR